MNDIIHQSFKNVAYLFKKKSEYNLLSENSVFRYSYCLNRLKSYIESKEFENIDELILSINDWSIDSSISSTIKNKVIDMVFLLSRDLK